jgi:glycine cleavage system H protein
VIESVKAPAECKAPVSGTVLEVNSALADEPGMVNRDRRCRLVFKLKLADPKQLDSLLDEATYLGKLEK